MKRFEGAIMGRRLARPAIHHMVIDPTKTCGRFGGTNVRDWGWQDIDVALECANNVLEFIVGCGDHITCPDELFTRFTSLNEPAGDATPLTMYAFAQTIVADARVPEELPTELEYSLGVSVPSGWVSNILEAIMVYRLARTEIVKMGLTNAPTGDGFTPLLSVKGYTVDGKEVEVIQNPRNRSILRTIPWVD